MFTQIKRQPRVLHLKAKISISTAYSPFQGLAKNFKDLLRKNGIQELFKDSSPKIQGLFKTVQAMVLQSHHITSNKIKQNFHGTQSN